jgi:hypothetical protein
MASAQHERIVINTIPLKYRRFILTDIITHFKGNRA